MDSGNSGSLQPSSDGDDEFDLRCGGGVGTESLSLSTLLRQTASPSPSMAGFGGSFYGLQNLVASSLPPSPQAVHQWSAALSLSSSSSHGMPASADQAVTAPAQQLAPAPPRGSRKQTWASRCVPTTVLTTDTTNFRAMVQEFTDIPSPPFAGPPARFRFEHLFPSSSSLRSVPSAATTAVSFPPYLLRPFAQKLQSSNLRPFASPYTSMATPSGIATASPTAASASTSVAVAVSDESYQYHLLAPAPAPFALLGMRDHGNDYLSFHSPLNAQLGGSNAAKYASRLLFNSADHGLLPS